MVTFEEHMTIEDVLTEMDAANVPPDETTGDFSPVRAFLRNSSKKAILAKALEFVRARITNQVQSATLDEFLAAIGSALGKITGDAEVPGAGAQNNLSPPDTKISAGIPLAQV